LLLLLLRYNAASFVSVIQRHTSSSFALSSFFDLAGFVTPSTPTTAKDDYSVP